MKELAMYTSDYCQAESSFYHVKVSLKRVIFSTLTMFLEKILICKNTNIFFNRISSPKTQVEAVFFRDTGRKASLRKPVCPSIPLEKKAVCCGIERYNISRPIFN